MYGGCGRTHKKSVQLEESQQSKQNVWTSIFTIWKNASGWATSRMRNKVIRRENKEKTSDKKCDNNASGAHFHVHRCCCSCCSCPCAVPCKEGETNICIKLKDIRNTYTLQPSKRHERKVPISLQENLPHFFVSCKKTKNSMPDKINEEK